ncbi:hypothetical protein GI374_13160 [Paracoccus sp. S-4012]|uniref:hypothetical protein n=1 Tax=Paracoccus sp. S-4012 TaxID=2665648 RepID=UPI0012B13E5C|nr:hypothetical protein [Paracoccus sp. S-4012]MRX51372.1 hypothetical protein [Paracoccus sp. S-4012]
MAIPSPSRRATPAAILVGLGLVLAFLTLVLSVLGTGAGLGLPLIATALVSGGAGHAAGGGLLGGGQAGVAAIFGGVMMAALIFLGLWAAFDPNGWRGFVVYSVMLASLCPAMMGLAIAAWSHLYGSRA